MADIAAALACGILSGMGVGSGGLFMIYLVLFAGKEQLAAQGMNLLFFLFSAGASLPRNVKRCRPELSAVICLCIFGAVGAFFGSRLAAVLDGHLLKKLFGALIAISGIAGLVGKGRKREKT